MRHPSLIPLSHDHHHGLALALRCRKQALGQLTPLGAAGLKERAAEFHDFFLKNLVAHFRAEEKVLFPWLRREVPECGSIIDQLLDDHRRIRATIPRLEAGSGLGKVLFDLGDLLERHIRKEERELFPLYEERADDVNVDTVAAELKKVLGWSER